MDFIEVEIECVEEFREILMAELSELEFDTFMETDDGFMAYVEQGKFQAEALHKVLKKYEKPAQIHVATRHVKEKNWNEEWEKNYDPVIIEEKCLIRASFHELGKSFPYEILINPRMSFGTGHHDTTYLMASYQLEIDHQGKNVMDIGCGTGILAILAAKLGAAKVIAIDNNEWAYNNALDNVLINDLEKKVEIRLGTIYDSGLSQNFDLILANINRNVLLDELPDYVKMLNEGGGILISGFYEEDQPDMVKKLTAEGYKLVFGKTRNRWAALYFIRK